MDFIKSIPYELNIREKIITIKIGEIDEGQLLIFEDKLNSESQVNEQQSNHFVIKIIIPNNFSFTCLKFILYRIIAIENQSTFGNIILYTIFKTIENTLTEMTERLFKTDNETTVVDFLSQYKNDIIIHLNDLHDNEKWMVMFCNQMLNFGKLFQSHKFKDCSIELFNKCKKMYERFGNYHQKIILTKLKVISDKESDDLIFKNAWTFLKNEPSHKQKILYLAPTSELTLKKLGDELNKFMMGILNHQILSELLSKMLKIIQVDSYSSILGTSIPMINNNRVTPALYDRNYEIYSKSLTSKTISSIDCVLNMLFRSVGIKLVTSENLLNIFITLLYSGNPLDENLKEYIIMLFSQSNHFNISDVFSLSRYSFNDFIHRNVIILLVRQRQIVNEFDKGLFEHGKFSITKEHLPKPLDIRNIMIINYMYYILNNPDYNDVFKIKYVKSLKAKITSLVSALPIDEPKVSPIVEIIMKCYFKNFENKKMNINGFMSDLKCILIANYISDIDKYNQYSFDIEKLTLDSDENKKINLKPMFKNMLFGDFIHNCQLCDNLYFICQNHCHIMACQKHNICYECWAKIFATKIFNQSQQINIMNFVCPICREPEPNSIYSIPANFYETPEKHCLCSYQDCLNIVKMSNLPPCQAAVLIEEQQPQDQQQDQQQEQPQEHVQEHYCEQHLRLLRLMSYVPVEMINTVKECPGCNNLINRVDGCSHITCQCGKQFCWVCDYIHENNEITYNHASYCRGSHKWEKSLSLLLNVSNRMLNEIKNFYESINHNHDDDVDANNIINNYDVDIHRLISVWLNNDFSSPEINAQSFWNFQIWLNSAIGFNHMTILPQIIAEICEWLQTPANAVSSIAILASNLKSELLQIKSLKSDLLQDL